MKNLIFTMLILCVFSSCKSDETLNLKQFPQKWQLIKTTGQIPGTERTGNDMEWQEFYVLNLDGTFTKTREQDGKSKQASGTFTYKVLPDERYLILVYETENDLIGNCTSEPKEELLVLSDDRLASTWLACDGPGLEYSRVE